MSDVAISSAGQVVSADATKGKASAASKKKTTAVKTTKKHAVEHPKYSEMVKAALSGLKERGGSSRQAVLKYIMKNFKVGNDENVVNTHLKIALRSGVKNASLKQSKGTGAAGSFRLGEEAKKKPKAAATTAAKKTTTKKAKTPSAVKKVAGDKSVKSPVKKMTKKATTKAASASKTGPKKSTTSKPKATPKKSKTDKPKKAAVPKVKADKPKKSSPTKVVKKPAVKKTPIAKKSTKPAASVKKA
jgi:hypothetical protein